MRLFVYHDCQICDVGQAPKIKHQRMWVSISFSQEPVAEINISNAPEILNSLFNEPFRLVSNFTLPFDYIYSSSFCYLYPLFYLKTQGSIG